MVATASMPRDLVASSCRFCDVKHNMITIVLTYLSDPTGRSEGLQCRHAFLMYEGYKRVPEADGYLSASV